jgi:hypothetical protein
MVIKNLTHNLIIISDRYGKTFAAIIEIGSVINDFKIDAIGGLKAGLDIFELCIIPSLLNNSDMWVEIESASIKRLEDMQNMMFKNLFAVPHSVPTPSLRSDLGCWQWRRELIKETSTYCST